MDELITLDYGSGGKKTARLIEEYIVPAFENPALRALGDGALLSGAEKLVFSTDSFVVDPIFFPAGISAGLPSAARSTTCAWAAERRST